MYEDRIMSAFFDQVSEGIPAELPPQAVWHSEISHAPKRMDVLTRQEKEQALKNALRYFKSDWHGELAEEFWRELQTFGRIYMYRFRPSYEMRARPHFRLSV